MKIKMCLPIIKTNLTNVEKMIEKNLNTYDFFELWVDYLEDDLPRILSVVKDLSHKFNDKLIIVFRRKNGDIIHMPFENRLEIVKALCGSKTFVDLDIQKQLHELEEIKSQKMNVRVIASFHDYKKTPRTSALVKIIHDMELFQPEIYKLATFCQIEKQAVSLLHLLLDLKEQHKKCIILGMGKQGIITRIFGSMWGNEMIFAPEEISEETAPGQLTKRQLEQIFAIVEEAYAR